MTPITLDQIRRSTDARLIGADPAILLRHICTDSREIEPGCLFIAIKGENHDGHDHVAAAIKAGALAAMVNETFESPLPLLRVSDPRKAMGRLANFVRSNLKSKVIAVAGSNGKTGTKNLLHAALGSRLSGSISPKSFNNDIGVPTTIFAANPEDDYLVLEIGTNHPGEILNLTRIAQPDIAIITNIGAEHLEFLGDLDGVLNENAQIIAGLNPDGLLVINGDSPGLAEAVQSYPGRKITFGFEAGNDLRAADIDCRSDGIAFRVEGEEVFTPLLGRHTAANALAAIAVARWLGIEQNDIFDGLSKAAGPEMRLQLQTAGSIRILNDAYNANPHSMQAALHTLRDMQTAGRRVAILGDMRELGPTAEKYHREIGRLAAECELDQLLCVGESAKYIAEAAIQAGMPDEWVNHHPTAADCAASISSILSENDLILLKASRTMRLETIATSIMAASAEPGLRRELARRERRIGTTQPTVQVAL